MQTVKGLLGGLKDSFVPERLDKEGYERFFEDREKRTREERDSALQSEAAIPDHRASEDTMLLPSLIAPAIIFAVLVTGSIGLMGLGLPPDIVFFLKDALLLSLFATNAFDVGAIHKYRGAPEEPSINPFSERQADLRKNKNKVKEGVKNRDTIVERIKNKATPDKQSMFLIEKKNMEVLSDLLPQIGVSHSQQEGIDKRKTRLEKLQQAEQGNKEWMPYWKRTFSEGVHFQHENIELFKGLGKTQTLALLTNGYNKSLAKTMQMHPELESARRLLMRSCAGTDEEFEKALSRLNTQTIVGNSRNKEHSLLSCITAMIEVMPDGFLKGNDSVYDGIYTWGSRKESDLGQTSIAGAIKSNFVERVRQKMDDPYAKQELGLSAFNDGIETIHLTGPCQTTNDSDIDSAIREIKKENPELENSNPNEIFNAENIHKAFRDEGFSDLQNSRIKTNMETETFLHEAQHSNFGFSKMRKKQIKGNVETEMLAQTKNMKDFLLSSHYANLKAKFSTESVDISDADAVLHFLKFDPEDKAIAIQVAKAITLLSSDKDFTYKVGNVEVKPNFPSIQDKTIRLLKIASSVGAIENVIKSKMGNEKISESRERIRKTTGNLREFMTKSRATTLYANIFSEPERGYNPESKPDENLARISENKNELMDFIQDCRKNKSLDSKTRKMATKILKSDVKFQKKILKNIAKKHQDPYLKKQDTKIQTRSSLGSQYNTTSTNMINFAKLAEESKRELSELNTKKQNAQINHDGKSEHKAEEKIQEVYGNIQEAFARLLEQTPASPEETPQSKLTPKEPPAKTHLSKEESREPSVNER